MRQTQPKSSYLDLLGPSTVFLAYHRLHPPNGGNSTISHWSMSLTLHGRIRSFFPEGMPDIEAGDWVLVRPSVMQHWQIAECRRDGTPLLDPGWVAISALFQTRPHWIEYFQNLELWPGVFRMHLTGRCLREVRRSMACALRAYKQHDPHREKWAMLHIERALLRLYDEQGAPSRTDLDGRVARALEYIHKNLGNRLTLVAIADVSHTSVSHLLGLFKTQMGMTPMAYVEQARMQRAQEMLKYTFYPVAQIATLLGYEQPSYFVQRFHRAIGVTPLAYRKMEKNSIAE